MKKNIAMRVAAILFILTMISTCAFSTTFAKYVTTAETGDTARVAKWGVDIVVGINSKDLFISDYDAGESYTVSAFGSTDRDDLLAPGTNGGTASITVTGKPEVSVGIVYTASLSLTGWDYTYDHDSNDKTDKVVYCPIIFTVNGTEYKVDPTNAAMDTVTELEEAVVAAITGCSSEYDPNTDLSTTPSTNVSVTWKWAYESGVDAGDTYYGDKAADATAPEVDFYMDCTATQLGD